MRLTVVLRKQHLGFHFKKNWHIQSKRKVLDAGVEAVLTQRGTTIYQPTDILFPKIFDRVEVIGPKPKTGHVKSNWNERVCYTFNDCNVLLEGLDQAQIITNSVQVTAHELPEKLKNAADPVPKNIDDRIKQLILSSFLFDAQQEKLPKRKDPERPAWNFPRDYGVTRKRAQKLLTERLIQLIEVNSDLELTRDRNLIDNLHFQVSFEKFNQLLQFRLKSDSTLLASNALTPLFDIDTTSMPLPDIFPVDPLITLKPEHDYQLTNVYPVRGSHYHPHTIIAYYDDDVKNLYEEAVTEPQFLGRTLLKAFTAASAYAKHIYGDHAEKVKTLPQPITIQCIQTNGQLFDFGILQLNTLDPEEKAVKNVWYRTDQMPLFESCSYIAGKPTLQGYNSNVFRYLVGFYRNRD